MDFTGRLSLQAVEREALIVLFDGLNDMISAMTTTWNTEDDALQTALGRSAATWTVESIPNENFYAGTIPSLINAPIEKYPNICVVCYQAEPKPSSDDTAENYTHTLAVEIMVRSGSFNPDANLSEGLFYEQEVNSRIQKTLDAAHLTILDNRRLNNTVPELPAPIVNIGDLFVRRAAEGSGDRWYWQGGSLTYNLDKYVNLV